MNLYAPLTEAIIKKYSQLEAEDLAFCPPPKLELGDVALRLFVAAKKLGTPPPKLAEEIAQQVDFGPEVLGTTVTGPYLNIKLDRSAYAKRIVRNVLSAGNNFGSNDSGKGQTVLLEHTSINPNASPHVGRARNAMIGDSLVRLLRFEGYEVQVHYYVNDMGRQIGLLVMSCEEAGKLVFDAGKGQWKLDTSFDDILDLYVKANERAESDPEFAEKGYELLVKMEEDDHEVQDKFRAVTDLCINGQLEVLARLGATYDVFDRESKYVKHYLLDSVLDALKEKGALFTDEDERLVVDLSKLGHDREEGRYFVLMRANGSSMYGYRDIAYTIDKMNKNAGLDIVVLGEDHKLYAQQIEMILGAAGQKAPEVVHYAYILLKEGKMSTRQGKVVLLSEFLDEATARSAERVAEQCTDLDADEQKAIAEKVAVAAIRFAVLKVGPNKNVIFDWDASLSFSGDTGPYAQYCCARINSILRKFGDMPEAIDDAFPIETDAEWALLSKLASFTETVEQALKQRNCAPIAQFALDTARLFTTFYHECPVLKAETEQQKNARAQVCQATKQTIQNALSLLGIETPEQM